MLESSSIKRYPLAAISLLCLIGTVFVFYEVRKNRHFSIIRAAAPNFLLLMCIGALLLFLMPWVMVSYPPTKAQCVARLWVGFTGFTVLFTALFAKTFRIMAIFGAKLIQRVMLPDEYLLKVLGGFIGVLWLYLLIWSVADPPEPTIFSSVVSVCCLLSIPSVFVGSYRVSVSSLRFSCPAPRVGRVSPSPMCGWSSSLSLRPSWFCAGL